MHLKLEIPDDQAAALTAKAAAQGLTLEDWFKSLAGEALPEPGEARSAAESVLEGVRKVPAGKPGTSLKLPALPLGDLGSLHRRDIYDDAS